jgi:hypothetical protein
MQQIYDTFNKWLVLKNNDLLDVAVGTVLGNRLEGRPIFMVLVGPSGCGKSEVIEAFDSNANTLPLSTISTNTFISGLKGKEEEASLLLQLDPKKAHLFTFKDLTTTLSDNADNRAKVLSQLREIYDGSFTKGTGSGRPRITWKGKVGVLAGCTGVFDEISQQLSSLGERYLVYRVPLADRLMIADSAGRSTNQEVAMKAEMRRAMLSVDAVRPRPVPISYDVRQYLNMLCDFLAHLRTPVRRDRYSRDLLQLPEIESTARISRQFTQLIQGVTLARGVAEPGHPEVAIMDQVAVSSVPSLRLKVITGIPTDGIIPFDLVDRTGLPKTSVYRLVEDLELLGLVTREGTATQGQARFLRPTAKYGPFFGVARRIVADGGWGW